MKKTYLLKTVFTLIMCGFFSMTQAATIYLSATGSDSNDGLTMGTAVKSFSKAHDLASPGDTVMVSGMIDFSVDTGITIPNGFALTKNLIIEGTSNTTDGFDGKGATQLIQSSGFNLSLSNLKLTGGSASGNGGALLLTGGTVTITKVIFDGNTAAVRGGAISIEPATALTLNFNNCVLKNNSSTTEGGAFYYGDSVILANSVKFTNCALVSNTSGGTTTGGAAYISSATASATLQLFFINTTIAKNTAGGNSAGGIFIANAYTGSNINFTNCTVTENTCLTVGTAGAGIRVASAVTTNGGAVKFYNSILENNFYPGTLISSATYAIDLAWQGELFIPGTTLIMENSIVGKPGSPTKPAWAQTSFPNSKFNYVNSSSGNVPDSYIAKFDTFNTTTNSYALLNDSFALSYGSTAYLTGLMPSVTTDQLGNTRPAPSCSAGSVEKYPTAFALGLKKNLQNSMMVYRNANNQITVENSSNDFTGSITVYNILGQVVAKTPATGAITTINKSLNSGVYIVKLNNSGESYSKKVIIN